MKKILLLACILLPIINVHSAAVPSRYLLSNVTPASPISPVIISTESGDTWKDLVGSTAVTTKLEDTYKISCPFSGFINAHIVVTLIEDKAAPTLTLRTRYTGVVTPWLGSEVSQTTLFATASQYALPNSYVYLQEYGGMKATQRDYEVAQPTGVSLSPTDYMRVYVSRTGAGEVSYRLNATCYTMDRHWFIRGSWLAPTFKVPGSTTLVQTADK